MSPELLERIERAKAEWRKEDERQKQIDAKRDEAMRRSWDAWIAKHPVCVCDAHPEPHVHED